MNKIVCEEKARPLRPVRRQLSVSRAWMYLLLFLCLTAGVGQAQNVGSVFGTVVDSTGALIAGAKATLSEPEHGFSRTVTSNAGGAYLFPDIPVGTYTLTVEAPKFE